MATTAESSGSCNNNDNISNNTRMESMKRGRTTGNTSPTSRSTKSGLSRRTRATAKQLQQLSLSTTTTTRNKGVLVLSLVFIVAVVLLLLQSAPCSCQPATDGNHQHAHHHHRHHNRHHHNRIHQHHDSGHAEPADTRSFEPAKSARLAADHGQTAPSDNHQWLALNETLRLLAIEEAPTIGEKSHGSRASKVPGEGLAKDKHDGEAEEEEAVGATRWRGRRSSIGSGHQGADEREKQATKTSDQSNGKGGKSESKTTTTTTTPPNDKNNLIRRVIVRELTRLIMDNEPEQIAATVGAQTPIGGQILSEPGGGGGPRIAARGPLLARSSHHVVDEAEAEAGAEEEDDSGLTAAPYEPDGGGGNNNNNNFGDSGDSDGSNPHGPQQQHQDAGAAVTCSPDYEDPAMVEAAASGGNLTAEQQQQLLAGADSSGLLIPVAASGQQSNNNNNNNNNDSSQQQELALGEQQQQQQQLIKYHQRLAAAASHCIHPGSRMIAFITTVITPILFSFIIIVGLLGNIIVMLVILEDRKIEREMTPTNLLILDLSLADLSFIIFCIPFTGWDYAGGQWIFGSLWCKFNQYLIVVCALSSIYTLVLMSIDRFMAIVYPIECISYRTSKNMLYAIYIKWIIILLIALPTWLMHGLLDSPLKPGAHICRFLSDQYNPLRFQIVFFITSYLFPLLLIFILYISLLNKLWFGSKPHGHRESLKMLESKKRVTWLVAGIVVVFALCWCPIQVMLILMRLKIYDITPTYVAIQVFAHTLGYMNSCINPIVYAFASENFHHSFKRSWLGRWLNYLFCCGQSGAVDHLDHTAYGMNNNHNHNNHSMTTNHFTADRMTSTRMSGPNPMSTLGVGFTGGSSGGFGMRNQSLNHIFNHSSNGNNNNNNLAGNNNGRGNNNNNNNSGNLNSERDSKGTSLTHEGSASTSTLLMTPHHHRNGADSLGASSKQSSPHLGPQQSVLPLEPRDRPTTQEPRRSQTPTPRPMGSQPKQQQQVLIPRQPTASEYVFGPPLTSKSSSSSSTFNCPTNGATNTTTTTTTTTIGAGNPPKQQLVARMVNRSSTSNPQMVSHQCEPQQPEQES